MLPLRHSNVKRPCLPPPNNRADISALPQACGPDVDEFFLRDHLRSPPIRISATRKILEDIQTITTASSEEVTYSPTATLLTTLSEELYSA